jgi:hypothetical protein
MKLVSKACKHINLLYNFNYVIQRKNKTQKKHIHNNHNSKRQEKKRRELITNIFR